MFFLITSARLDIRSPRLSTQAWLPGAIHNGGEIFRTATQPCGSWRDQPASHEPPAEAATARRDAVLVGELCLMVAHVRPPPCPVAGDAFGGRAVH
jgi:hypothetical protein